MLESALWMDKKSKHATQLWHHVPALTGLKGGVQYSSTHMVRYKREMHAFFEAYHEKTEDMRHLMLSH